MKKPKLKNQTAGPENAEPENAEPCMAVYARHVACDQLLCWSPNLIL